MLQWKQCKKIDNRNGFAFMDVLLGIAIITLAFLGVAFAYRQSTVTTVSARNYNQATYYAQQALEQLKVNDGAASATWTTNTAVAATGAMPAFTIATAVLAAGSAPEYDALDATVRAKLIPVRATVTWRELSGAAAIDRTVTAITYYYLK
jgi:Tfp pilus assembly protein PilV